MCTLTIGVGLIDGRTSRPAGVVLLLAFVAAIVYLVRASRDHAFLQPEEVKETEEEPRSYAVAIGLTVVGLVVIALGGELVTRGAAGIVSVLGLSPLLVGMVVTPAAIEIEEVIRQAIPAREGRREVSAGNLVGTLLYFLWFNMGLISLFLPVRADPLEVRPDWPYLVGVTWLATLFFARGRVGRSDEEEARPVSPRHWLLSGGDPEVPAHLAEDL